MLLGSIGEEAIIAAAKSMEMVIFKRGDIIIKQNEIGDSFYILESGLLSVQVISNPLIIKQII